MPPINVMLLATGLLANLFVVVVIYINTRSLKQNFKELFSSESDVKRQAQIQQQLDSLAALIDKNLNRELSGFKDKLFEMQFKSQNDLLALLSKFDHQTQERSEAQAHRLKIQLTDTLSQLQKQIQDALQANQFAMNKEFEKLSTTTENRLNHIGEKVETKLQEGFEKTSQTFTDIVKRLALIDDAQKKIHDLSSNVVSLQEILQDKRSRGAFGEIQLNHLLENCLPPNGFATQYTLPNQYRVDAMLFLPKPTGHIAVDAKFPLDSYKLFTNIELAQSDRLKAQAQFKIDIKKHIQDISKKYILPGETSDGAIMFIPAEAVFAEIHAHFPELVELAYQNRVWLTSPTTMMAILTTASAVLKDSATKEQVHIIQRHLKDLSMDFGRFEKRMDNLAKHLHQANMDVELVHKTSKKISSRFSKIESVDLTEEKPKPLVKISAEDESS